MYICCIYRAFVNRGSARDIVVCATHSRENLLHLSLYPPIHVLCTYGKKFAGAGGDVAQESNIFRT